MGSSKDSGGGPSWAQLALRLGLFSLRNRLWRRRLMFYVTLAALGQLAVGLFVFEPLTGTLFELLYWGFCLCLVGLMVLLALYDMLAVRQEQRLEVLRLRARMLEESQAEEKIRGDDDSGNTGTA